MFIFKCFFPYKAPPFDSTLIMSFEYKFVYSQRRRRRRRRTCYSSRGGHLIEFHIINRNISIYYFFYDILRYVFLLTKIKWYECYSLYKISLFLPFDFSLPFFYLIFFKIFILSKQNSKNVNTFNVIN